MKYLLQIDINPVKHYIHVRGTIQNPTSNEFYLNENFNIISASSSDKLIKSEMDRSKPHPAFDTVSRPVTFDTNADNISFEYDGYIPDVINETNQLDENIIELASYSGWYPKTGDFNEVFDFELEISIPSGYEIASNGRVLDYNHITAKSQSDIAFFASNQVIRYEYSEQSIKCNFLCPSDMISQMEQRAKEIVKANILFEELYGNLSDEGTMTEVVSVFRPGGGWGYKRGNLTVVSAECGKDEKDYILDFHELAHGWWGIADVTTDDWINEGGAEFSAYIAAKKLYGSEYANKYVDNCIKEIEKASENIAIADTDFKSKDRYINHYLKTTLMYINAQNLFGDSGVFKLLNKVYQTYKDTRNVTTEGFISLCDNDMKVYFEECLYSKDWDQIIKKYNSNKRG